VGKESVGLKKPIGMGIGLAFGARIGPILSTQENKRELEKTHDANGQIKKTYLVELKKLRKRKTKEERESP